VSRSSSRRPHEGRPTLDVETAERLISTVRSTQGSTWRELVALLWPTVAWYVRTSRVMMVLARQDDHVQAATLSVFEKLSRNGCQAIRLFGAWREAHADKTILDWLQIVSTNVCRDYVRACTGRGAGDDGIDKRLLNSLATLLPDEDALPKPSTLSATSTHAAREIARWADEHLPAAQRRGLEAWLAGDDFDVIAEAMALADAAAAKRLVRAAIASLRRFASVA
jgi:hypothetical protein